MTKRGRCYGFTILLVFALILGGCGGNTTSNKAANEKDFKPSKAIEVVAPAGAGGDGIQRPERSRKSWVKKN
ncbi:hypothetical protein AAGG52_07730 [Bacillus licheniformis]